MKAQGTNLKFFSDQKETHGGLRASTAPVVTMPKTSVEENNAFSIFHEPWWLDITTGGHWDMVKVVHGNQLLGQFPYCFTRKGAWRISHLPALTHTLGPSIKPMGFDSHREQTHRQTITSSLIEQLPYFDSFYQLLDTRIEDALAFSLHGFSVSVRYTFQISPEQTVAEAWTRMHSKTRNVIRGAAKALTVAPVDTPVRFLQFYEANLQERSRKNAYGSGLMRELVNTLIEHNAGHLLGAYDSKGKLVAAIGLVWDKHAMYYLMSSREAGTHGGAISLLIWTAIQQALQRNLTFDLDGFYSRGTCKFLEGFGGALKQRLCVERASTAFSLARVLRNRFMPNSDTGLTSPHL